LKSAHPGKVSPGVRAPVAQKADDYGFKLFVGHSVLLLWSKQEEDFSWSNGSYTKKLSCENTHSKLAQPAKACSI
jgi:hypothetical protein